MVIAGTLDRVTHSVSKIEKRRSPVRSCYLHHDFRLDLDVARMSGARFSRSTSSRRGTFRVGDDGVLDDFGEALIELRLRQRFQDIQIVDHERRMMNCADQIFPAPVLHRFSRRLSCPPSQAASSGFGRGMPR
jgi:hypothetical protein